MTQSGLIGHNQSHLAEFLCLAEQSPSIPVTNCTNAGMQQPVRQQCRAALTV